MPKLQKKVFGCGLACRTHLVNMLAGEYFKLAFLSISPDNKISAIVDTMGPGRTHF